MGLGDSAQMVSTLIEKVAVMDRNLLQSEKDRRGLHNELVELRGNIRVFCRIRPTGGSPVAEATASDAVRLMVDAKPNDFTFDKFAPSHLLSSPCCPCCGRGTMPSRAMSHTKTVQGAGTRVITGRGV